jgi:hypothetical protein
VLVVIEIKSRVVHVLGVSRHPVGTWVTQVARNLVSDLDEGGRRFRFLVRGEVGGWLGVGCVPQAPSAGPQVSRSPGLGSLGSASLWVPRTSSRVLQQDFRSGGMTSRR